MHVMQAAQDKAEKMCDLANVVNRVVAIHA
jgi:hypothetical protein